MLMQRLFSEPDTSIRNPIDPSVVLTIRWLAITGQLMALTFTYFVLGFDLPLMPALFIVGLSVLMNLWQNRQAKDDTGLVEQNLLALIFDILQLAALLFLTGGLLNPFSVLLLAPVVVSATMLRRRATLVLILTVAASVSVLALYNHPLPWNQDMVDLPGLYVAGLWMSLVLSTIFIGGYVWWVVDAFVRPAARVVDGYRSRVQTVDVWVSRPAKGRKFGSAVVHLYLATSVRGTVGGGFDPRSSPTSHSEGDHRSPSLWRRRRPTLYH